jgi:hypothetical protein
MRPDVGEAKRKRDLANAPATIKAMNIATGKDIVCRVSCSPYEYIKQLRHSYSGPLGVDTPVHVPCGTCNACCWHSFIDIDPKDEDPADLQHLDYIEDPAHDAFKLRKKDDGSCVHLGPNGCTVYAHRPKACRRYDCRLMAVFGIKDPYENGHESPNWFFPPKTDEEAFVFKILSGTATYKAATTPKANAVDIATEALRNLDAMTNNVAKLFADPNFKSFFDNMRALPEDERQKLAERYNQMAHTEFAKAVKRTQSE